MTGSVHSSGSGLVVSEGRSGNDWCLNGRSERPPNLGGLRALFGAVEQQNSVIYRPANKCDDDTVLDRSADHGPLRSGAERSFARHWGPGGKGCECRGSLYEESLESERAVGNNKEKRKKEKTFYPSSFPESVFCVVKRRYCLVYNFPSHSSGRDPVEVLIARFSVSVPSSTRQGEDRVVRASGGQGEVRVGRTDEPRLCYRTRPPPSPTLPGSLGPWSCRRPLSPGPYPYPVSCGGGRVCPSTSTLGRTPDL